jgi:hypothetical protein
MYVVYAIGLDGYVGVRLSPSQAILKVGVSVHDVEYRLDANERYEGKNSYRALFKKIEVLGQKKFPTKEAATAYEQALLQELGGKDLSIHEQVKGVTELRVMTPDRLAVVQQWMA